MCSIQKKKFCAVNPNEYYGYYDCKLYYFKIITIEESMNGNRRKSVAMSVSNSYNRNTFPVVIVAMYMDLPV